MYFAIEVINYIEIGAGVLVSGGIAIFLSKRKQAKYSQARKPVSKGLVVEAPKALEDRISKTRGVFSTSLTKLRGKSTVDPSFYSGVEEMLLLGDVGSNTTDFIISNVKAKCDADKVSEIDVALKIVGQEIENVFLTDRESKLEDGKMNVWLFSGVNGVGKTTSIAKIAQHFKNEGKTVLLVAADTFRAAAADQLEKWANRIEVDIVRSNEGADPASVVFDGMEKANAKKYDLVLVDTAGRLHTKSNLMEEIKKIRRIIEKTQGALKETFLVLDATTGQNGLVQAREFSDALDVSGVILTKLDGSAKGGITLAIEHELGIPTKWVGIGEGQNDLIPFNPNDFVNALMS